VLSSVLVLLFGVVECAGVECAGVECAGVECASVECACVVECASVECASVVSSVPVWCRVCQCGVECAGVVSSVPVGCAGGVSRSFGPMTKSIDSHARSARGREQHRHVMMSGDSGTCIIFG
jgi:hypothetical protein